MKITSYGASEGVTGSCHLLEVNGKRILIDCGIFQGSKIAREKNAAEFGFDPTSIDHLIISHAHLDHIGRTPQLWKRGFRGTITSTRPTFELARLSLLDSANILQQDAKRRNRKRDDGEPLIKPIYDDEDVLDTVEYWTQHVEYEQVCDLCEGVQVTFHDAGHILGSAFLDFQLTEGDLKKRFIFSGDLGNVNKPIIRDPRSPSDLAPADLVMIESTYGDRNHRPFSQSIAEIEGAICETVAGGGNVVIPTFALERAQELLYVLHDAWTEGRIPESVRIFLDSPMAISATRIFQNHPSFYDDEAAELFDKGIDPFHFPALEYTRDARDSMEINNVRSGAVILAGSGMVTGGRVIHHLRHNLTRSDCSVCFIGFQAEGTTGRKIVDGAEFVTLFGHSVPTGAKIYTVNGFSGHAGRAGLTKWVQETGAKNIRLVHGEPGTKRNFKTHLEVKMDCNVEVMPHAESIDFAAL